MKTVIVALFVLLAVSQSEALRCHCGGLQTCGSSQDSCFGRIWVCAKVINIVGSNPNFLQGCLSATDCMMLNRPGISSSSCCSTDLCNS
ncbi:hypothetical protein KUCAC02_027305 [Chaenocephalus aceratus]|uniref:Uncharacterized protein n=1 Tax=Chaenocephalus aceratus TaxID=36190 RepID=A0ACB9W422_CHAAC|nr:hypothetical protein KUCAC02_027305 [Chaenocephalus aceratus]